VQRALAVGARRPHLHVAFADPSHDPDGQQLACEDPLDRFVVPYVESHADGVRVVGCVAQSGEQGDGSTVGDHKPKAKLGGDGGAVHRQPNLFVVGPLCGAFTALADFVLEL
jgi:hypothetical protein